MLCINREKIRKVIREHEAAIKIARIYRKHLFHLYGRAITDAFVALKYLQDKAATRMASVARGRLARRRYATEKHLVAIKVSHPLLIQYALKHFPGRPKTFWYVRQIELDLLYNNYLDLVEKMGYKPPRIIVERNIAEMSIRVLNRKNALIVLVQKLWRGYIAKRIVRYYRTELSRLYSYSVAKVMKLQRVWRGHHARVNLRKLKAERRREKFLTQYLRQGNDQLLIRNRDKAKESILIHYQKERAEEVTARYIEKIPYALDQEVDFHGRPLTPSKRKSTSLANSTIVPFKMHIYHDSIFGDDHTIHQSLEILKRDKIILEKKDQEVLADMLRREFLHARIAERGPLGYGLRSGRGDLMELKDALMNLLRLQSGKPVVKPSTANPVKDCSRSRSMKYYFEKELDEIAQRAIQRISKLSKNATPGLDSMLNGDEDDAESSSKVIPVEYNNDGTKMKKISSEFRMFNRERLGDDYQIPGTFVVTKRNTIKNQLIANIANAVAQKVDASIAQDNKDRSSVAFEASNTYDDFDDQSVASQKSFSSASIVSPAPSRKGSVAIKSILKPTATVASSSTRSSLISPLQSKLLPKKEKKSHGSKIGKHYHFPKDVNFRGVDWLYEDNYDADL